ncbi:hypothetical protein NCLIV_056580 [Neospora caninum Liverpool]|uniref:Probable cytosolic iron-sulfur protein assembly protein CIAO1 homolog n=1 Tax=Neospora caninum (strain Liverpool) TaxID=572307 RepID=F0VND8_NEOCL|nr:hypothetical protein NCLIV_056580 [Neospora caninum Liverpool]CBZ55234.1 hypothetical protein NCLIV_056580 [Neospora caninum Liverpool]CEL69962.1 TPA: Probable cytosolic iron-sulfur protein assembly protein [Neospora caninum Liverpool]|eukprot:XP_003885262.1 hypothetical protein NCLIV_056580 [Neospora caninum Liverpool]
MKTVSWRLRRVARLRGHVGCAWGAAWRADGGLLATCGTDRRICLWAPSATSAAETDAPGDRSPQARSGRRGDSEASTPPHRHTRRGTDESGPEPKERAPPGIHTATGDKSAGSVSVSQARGAPHEGGTRKPTSNGAQETRGDKGGSERSQVPSWHLIGVIDTSPTHTRTIRNVAFSPDGFWLAAASFDATVSVWCSNVAGVYRAPSRFTQVQVLEGPEHEVKCVAWSRTGRYLATCSRDKTVWIFESSQEDREEVEAFAESLRPRRRGRTSAFRGPRGLRDAVQRGGREDGAAGTEAERGRWGAKQEEDDNLFLEERRDWPPPCQLDVDLGDDGFFFVAAVLSGHSQDVKAVRWHPREDLCISASYDDTFRVWGPQGGTGSDWGLLQVVRAHSSTVLSLAFDRLGSRLATCSDDRHVKIWTCLDPQLSLALGESPAAPLSPRSSLPSPPATAFPVMSSEDLSEQALPSPHAAAGAVDAGKRADAHVLERESDASSAPNSLTSNTPASATSLSSRILPPWYVTGIFRGASLGGGRVSPGPAASGDGATVTEESQGDEGDTQAADGEGRRERGAREGRGDAEGGTSDDGERRSQTVCAEGNEGIRRTDACGGSVAETKSARPPTACTEDAEKNCLAGGRSGPSEDDQSDEGESDSEKEERDKDELKRQRPDRWRPEAALLSDIHKRPVYFVDWHQTLDIIVTASGDHALRFFAADADEEGTRAWGLLLCKPDAHYSDINCAVWNPATPSSSRRSEVLLGTTNARKTAALLASVDDDGKVAIWSLEKAS